MECQGNELAWNGWKYGGRCRFETAEPEVDFVGKYELVGIGQGHGVGYGERKGRAPTESAEIVWARAILIEKEHPEGQWSLCIGRPEDRHQHLRSKKSEAQTERKQKEFEIFKENLAERAHQISTKPNRWEEDNIPRIA